MNISMKEEIKKLKPINIPYMSKDVKEQAKIYNDTVALMDKVKKDESVLCNRELTFDQALSIVSTARITGAIENLAHTLIESE